MIIQRFTSLLVAVVAGLIIVKAATAQTGLDAPESIKQTQRELPISIEADSAEQLEQQGLTVYRGNVRMTQGSLLIEASEIKIRSVKTVDMNNRQISKVLAIGEPAVFTHADGESNQVVAEANNIDYTPRKDTVVMKGGASLSRLGSSVNGEEIVYFISEQKVKAAADPESKQSRVKTVITPGQGFNFDAVKTDEAKTATPNFEETK